MMRGIVLRFSYVYAPSFPRRRESRFHLFLAGNAIVLFVDMLSWWCLDSRLRGNDDKESRRVK